jgi:HAD superfamily hydrolase (TIGR01459 family)
MRHLTGFAPLAIAYEGFVIDLWGVVHDGVRPYPGAADCLARLRAAGRRVALLSNAPRRSALVREALRDMGIADDLYDGVVTSGEATHSMLRDRPDPWWRALGTRLYHLGPERDRTVFADLGLEEAGDPGRASFVLNTGPDDHANPTDPAAFDTVLQACWASRLPMICANPDLEVIRGGVRVICAGALAQRYTAMGGDVRSLGKPDPAIYGPVLDLLGLPRERVLAVGDALRTDIAGAAAAGIASAWVLGGIHEAHLGESMERAEAGALAAGLSPVATLPRFAW